MGQLRDDLQSEIDNGGPGKIWYQLFQDKIKVNAGNWPPKDFVPFEPEAMNPNRWRFAEKLDLTQKLFEEQVLAPERGVISFVLSGESDGAIRSNIGKVVNQFLNEITKGADDKRAYELIMGRLERLGIVLGAKPGSALSPAPQDEEKTAAEIKRILIICKDRLPNALLPAGEGERESAIWSPAGYDSIVRSILLLDPPATQNALRAGISGALAVLRLALYYVDDIPEAAWHDDKAVFSGEEVHLVSSTDIFEPLQSLVANEDFEIANSVLAQLSPESFTLLSHVSISLNKVALAKSIGVSRGTVDKREKRLVIEVNGVFDKMSIPESHRQHIRSIMLNRVPEPIKGLGTSR